MKKHPDTVRLDWLLERINRFARAGFTAARIRPDGENTREQLDKTMAAEPELGVRAARKDAGRRGR